MHRAQYSLAVLAEQSGLAVEACFDTAGQRSIAAEALQVAPDDAELSERFGGLIGPPDLASHAVGPGCDPDHGAAAGEVEQVREDAAVAGEVVRRQAG
jgi:hypothetical protein